MSNSTVYSIPREHNRLLIITDVHHCRPVWHDTASSARMELLVKTLRDANEKTPADAILALGDYSLDFWAWNEGGSALWEEPVRNTEIFVKEYRSRFPLPCYMIPGNHEQYGSPTWAEITGNPREFALEYGETLFLMADTFGGDLDPDHNHDGCYTGLNVDFVTEMLDRYPEKQVILCAHDLIIEREGEEARKLICDNPRILCAFTGHTHRDNTRILPADWRSLPVFYSGDFSYHGGRGGEKNWGYRILELSEKGISTEYVRI